MMRRHLLILYNVLDSSKPLRSAALRFTSMLATRLEDCLCGSANGS